MRMEKFKHISEVLRKWFKTIAFIALLGIFIVGTWFVIGETFTDTRFEMALVLKDRAMVLDFKNLKRKPRYRVPYRPSPRPKIKPQDFHPNDGVEI